MKSDQPEALAPEIVADATEMKQLSGLPAKSPPPDPEVASHPEAKIADLDVGVAGDLTAEDLLFIQFMGC
jgi:hypothetical protein